MYIYTFPDNPMNLSPFPHLTSSKTLSRTTDQTPLSSTPGSLVWSHPFRPMGNCCLRGSRMVWAEADDDRDQWVYYSDPHLQQKQNLLTGDKVSNTENSSLSVNGSNNNGKNTEVKIIVSKKKLEQLLGKVQDLHNTPVDQILDGLLDSSNRFEFYDHRHHYQQQQQPWKPNLQSIPEDN